MKQFPAYLRTYASFSDAELQQICVSFEAFHVTAGTILLHEGEICRHLYFVDEGLLHFYFLRDGVEVTRYFTIAPYLFTSQRSFNLRQPANESIQALEDCRLWRLSAEKAEALFSLPAWNIFARKILQEVHFFTENIYTDLQTQTAEARYQQMLATQSDLLLRIPQKVLASFLGIAPQSLSRIRKKLACSPAKLT